MACYLRGNPLHPGHHFHYCGTCENAEKWVLCAPCDRCLAGIIKYAFDKGVRIHPKCGWVRRSKR